MNLKNNFIQKIIDSLRLWISIWWYRRSITIIDRYLISYEFSESPAEICVYNGDKIVSYDRFYSYSPEDLDKEWDKVVKEVPRGSAIYTLVYKTKDAHYQAIKEWKRYFMKKVFYEVFSFSSIKLCAHNMEISKKLGMPELYLHSVYPRRLEISLMLL